MEIVLTKEIARKVLSVVDHEDGLSSGLGTNIPGKMCVEAAVCFALGLPHGDNPPCVGEAVRSFKIALNDSEWSSKKARAKGMRKLSVAQLGSNEIDQLAFSTMVSIQIVRRLIPKLFKDLGIDGAQSCLEVNDLSSAKSAAWESYLAALAGDSAWLAAKSAAFSANLAALAAKSSEKSDEYLNLAAQIALEALIALQSPGCKWLDICE